MLGSRPPPPPAPADSPCAEPATDSNDEVPSSNVELPTMNVAVSLRQAHVFGLSSGVQEQDCTEGGISNWGQLHEAMTNDEEHQASEAKYELARIAKYGHLPEYRKHCKERDAERDAVAGARRGMMEEPTGSAAKKRKSTTSEPTDNPGHVSNELPTNAGSWEQRRRRAVARCDAYNHNSAQGTTRSRPHHVPKKILIADRKVFEEYKKNHCSNFSLDEEDDLKLLRRRALSCVYAMDARQNKKRQQGGAITELQEEIDELRQENSELRQKTREQEQELEIRREQALQLPDAPPPTQPSMQSWLAWCQLSTVPMWN